MMTTRQSLFTALFSCGLILAVLSGCSGGSAFMNDAQTAMEQQNYDQALASVDSAIARDTANVDAYLLKADILREMADSTMSPDEYKALYHQANDVEDRAIQMDPSVRSDVQTKRRLAYIQEFQRAAKAFNVARKSQRPDQFLDAAAYFGASGAIYPDSSGPYLNEAFARLNAGQREEAIPLLESYVERADSIQEQAYTILGQLYLNYEQPDAALELLEQATNDFPENEELQALLLNAYNRAGSTQQAMEAYREQIEENPNNATYRYNYGSLLLNEDRYDEAITHLSRAVELDPQDPKKQYNLGAAYINKGAVFQDSVNALRESVRQSEGEPTEEELKQLKSLEQEKRQLFKSAIPPLQRARQLSSQDVDYRQRACTALFQAYVQTEQQEQAQEVQSCAESTSTGGNGNANGGGN